MKNMKVAKKLLVGFSIAVALTLVVGVVSFFGMNSLAQDSKEMYYMRTVPVGDMAHILEAMQQIRGNMGEYIIGAAMNDSAFIEAARGRVDQFKVELIEHMDAYSPTIQSSEERRFFDEARRLLTTEYFNYLDQVYELSRQGRPQEAYQVLNQSSSTADTIVEDLDKCLEIKLDAAQANAYSNETMANTLTIVMALTIAAAVAISMTLALRISAMISKPLNMLTAFMQRAGSTGDISISKDDEAVLDRYAQNKDEIGLCIAAIAQFVDHITESSHELGQIAEGNLTVDVEVLTKDDTIGNSLNIMVDNLNAMFSELKTSSDQVSAGADQVSQGAQELASGSSEQAASVEELTATVNEVMMQVEQNAKRSEKALENTDAAGNLMMTSVESMQKMLEAMDAIDESSKSITRVIKVIDDIAFQTNILALNAAVEAARAGQHGKGFAVVADEVRGLAAKSAEAAKETATLIEGSSQRVSEGSRIVTQTNESLEAVNTTTTENAALIREIAKSLERQNADMVVINQGMEQISSVVQSNAATAEQSAAASEELSAQSVVMNEIVARFRLKGQTGFGSRMRSATPSASSTAMAASTPAPSAYSQSSGFSLSDGGSKY